jgi:hypothetical protein
MTHGTHGRSFKKSSTTPRATSISLKPSPAGTWIVRRNEAESVVADEGDSAAPGGEAGVDCGDEAVGSVGSVDEV